MAPTNNTNYQWIKNEKLSEGTQTCVLWSIFFFETKWQNWAKLQSFSLSLYEPKVWNTLVDTLLQHVTMTNHWLCTSQATSCVTRCNNKPLYVLGNFCENLYLGNRILSLNKSLLIWICVTSLVAGKNSFAETTVFTNSPVDTKKFVIAMCCRYVLVQLVT